MASVFTSVKTHLYETYMKGVDKVKPTLTESQFIQEGVLTPEEFVAAGDTLVFKCKTWEWASGDPARAVPYLPPNKQYLVTKNVRCAQRCSALEKACEGPSAGAARTIKVDVGGDLDDDEWVTTASDAKTSHTTTAAAAPVETIAEVEEIPSVTAPAGDAVENKAAAPFMLPLTGQPTADDDDDDDDDDDADVMDFNEEDLMEEDPAVAPPQAAPLVDPAAANAGDSAMADDGDDDGVLKTRTYDLYITYDHFYRTPRVWLSGYDEQMKPLQPAQVFEDISADHAHKTVTFDEFPHLAGVQMAYIHPCKHASVMKKIIARQMENARGAADIQVEQYLILFIKFISAVIPTIEYDFTMEIEG